jgi:subtilisin family serine protease
MLKFLMLFLILADLIHANDFFVRLSDEGLKNKKYLISKNLNHLQLTLHKSNLLKYQFKAEAPNISGPLPENLQRWMILSVDGDNRGVIEELQALNLIEYFEPSGYFKIDFFSNDSLSSQQWYLDKINLTDAWRVTKGNKSVIVAIIDTGIDFVHPDLQHAIWVNHREDINNNGYLDEGDLNGIDDDGNGFIDDVVGWDFTHAPRFADGGDYLDADNEPWDEFGSGHGTQIAGIIAAKDNNAIGISGIAPNVRIMNLRAGTAAGYLEEDDVARAIFYATENGASIINMSFGDKALSRFLKDVIAYAHQQGVILISSAGNSSSSEANFPASLPEVISVGASNANDGIAGFSNYGTWIDLVAPGTEMVSTAVGGFYNTVNGTSFSAPVVSAVAALVLSDDNSPDAAGMKNILKTSAVDIYNEGWDEFSGAGRVSAHKALNIPATGILNISHPPLNSSLAQQQIYIIGSAAHPDIKSFRLSISPGNSSEFTELAYFENQNIIDDTLAVFAPQFADTLYTLKLVMELFNNRIDEQRHTFRTDRSAPVITNITILPLWDGPYFSNLISFTTDDIAIVEVFIRNTDDENFMVVSSPYETKNHRLKIEDYRIKGEAEFYIQAQNLSGLISIDDNQGNLYPVSFNQEYKHTRFEELPWTLPAGHMLDFTTDFDNDGNAEIVISRYDDNFGYGPLEIYEFNNGQFNLQLTTAFKAIPRYAGDVDQDGKKDLLCGFGQYSFLLETFDGNGFPTELVWEDSSGFWSSIYTDIDGDNNFEITGRLENEWVLLENISDNHFQEIARLPNLSEGSNILGSPKAVSFDFNSDGSAEFIYGDYDGDLLVYTSRVNNQAEHYTTGKTANPNATEILTSYENYLYTATHTSDNLNYEHEFDARFWSIEEFRLEEDLIQNFRINTYGFAETRTYDSGLKITGFDDETMMFASFFPRLYIFEKMDAEWAPVWLTENARSNTVLIHDFDNDGRDEFYFNDGEVIKGFSKGIQNRPMTPFSFQITVRDSSSIELTWQNTIGAAYYNIYKGSSENGLNLYSSSILNTFSDTVSVYQKYFYAVSAIDSLFEQNESLLSPADSVQTEPPPGYISHTFYGDRQLFISFDKPVMISERNLSTVKRKSYDDFASSILQGNLKNSLLISFGQPFKSDNADTLFLSNIMGESGVPLHPASQTIPVHFVEELKAPYIRSISWQNKNELKIEFNEAMIMDSIEMRNFVVMPTGSATVIAVENETSMIVGFSKETYLRASGKASYLRLDGMVSTKNIRLADDTKVRLFTNVIGIEDVYIYPQPVKPQNNEVVFANIPEFSEIYIYNLNGRLVKQLTSESSYGGIIWDLKDNNGSMVSSGIYFYNLRWNDKSKQGKIAVIR